MTQVATLEAFVPRLPPAPQTFRVVRDAELVVRAQVDALEEDEDDLETARKLVLTSVLPLELTHFTACFAEVAAKREATAYADLDAHVVEVWEELRRRMRVRDLRAMLREHLPVVLERSGMTAEQLEATRTQPIRVQIEPRQPEKPAYSGFFYRRGPQRTAEGTQDRARYRDSLCGPLCPLRCKTRRILQVDALEAGSRSSCTQPIPPFPAVVRQAQAIVAACPIATIELAADVARLTEHGHRCRVAYDGLRAFLHRAKPGPIDDVGKAYARGALSISEAAAILDISRPDALMELEERGHCRSPEDLALSAEVEASAYDALRTDRERRRGQPEFDEEHVARDAIASERIEGVDARQWLRLRHG